MSGTRSHSQRAPVTEPGTALIVAHGSPSAPQGPEDVLRRLAAEVSGLLPAWRVRGATLAGRGTLEVALAEIGESRTLIYPFFMADGWFVRKMLPKRIRVIHGDRFKMVAPFGLDPALPTLCEDYLREAVRQEGLRPDETMVLLAAHGSPTDPRPRAAAERVTRSIGAMGCFRGISLGFLDERPSLAEAARIDGPAFCLPLFAGRAGHVERDLPEALTKARFGGKLLDPIGQRPGIAAMIAAALARGRRLVTAGRQERRAAQGLDLDQEIAERLWH